MSSPIGTVVIKRGLAVFLLIFFCVLLGYTEAIARVSLAIGTSKLPLHDGFRPEVVVVLGAAVWGHDRPSPVLERRLRKTLEIALEHNVQWIATTGGVGRITHRYPLAHQGPPLAEGVVSARWLSSHGFAPQGLLVEQRSRNTVENIRYLAPALRAHGLTRAVIVTDGYHIARSLMIAQDAGLDARGVACDGSVSESLAREPERRWSEARWLWLYATVRPTVRW